MKKLRIALLLLFAASGVYAQNPPQQSPAKEALLVANGDYAHFGKLPNPITDARLLGESLQRIGFQVTLVENATKEGMLDALNAFQDRLKAMHGIALFHYGGHGVQVGGRNFLIPADADIPDERKVATRAVDLEEVMTTLISSGASVNVVVLDACRDNPLPKTASRSASRGLTVVEIKPKNSIIVYAAEAGSKAEDGLFTPTLANVLTLPGLTLSQVMMKVRREVAQKSNGNQTPGEYNQLFEDVYLAGSGNQMHPLPQVMPPPATEVSPTIQPMIAVMPNSRPQEIDITRNDCPNLGASFSNSLGQRFVPIPNSHTYFCVWSTRVADYEKFISETTTPWKPAGFLQARDHPAVRVNYYDAVAFCNWLTQKEHSNGSLPPAYEYRLPKDLEWSAAAGITAKEIDGAPAWRSGGIPNCYAWGPTWPPPKGAGNYDPKLKTDTFPNTSPVGSFASNRFGLYDMNGNAYQWIQEDYDESGQGCVRGASWPDEDEESINLSNRFPASKDSAYKCYGFRCVIAPIAQKK